MAGVLKPAFDASIINCVVCHEAQPTPWRTCTTCSALICGPCVVKLNGAPTMCPLCRQALVWKHNVFAEHIAAQYAPFRVSCGHTGCHAEVPFDTLAAHRGVCLYRARPCPTGKKCPFKGSPREIIVHLGSEHNAIPLDATEIPCVPSTRESAASVSTFQVSIPKSFDHCYYYVPLDLIDGLVVIENISFAIQGYIQRTVITDLCKLSSENHTIMVSGERAESGLQSKFNFRLYECEFTSDEYSGFGIIADKPGPDSQPWIMTIKVTPIVRAKTDRDDVLSLSEQPDTKKTHGNEDEEKKGNDAVSVEK